MVDSTTPTRPNHGTGIGWVIVLFGDVMESRNALRSAGVALSHIRFNSSGEVSLPTLPAGAGAGTILSAGLGAGRDTGMTRNTGFRAKRRVAWRVF